MRLRAGGECSGAVTLNGEQVTERMVRQHSVICEQYDRHNAFLSVRETLRCDASNSHRWRRGRSSLHWTGCHHRCDRLLWTRGWQVVHARICVVVGELSVVLPLCWPARFAGKLYLAGRKERDNRVEEIITAFGLGECADTRVGNAFIRGISGGQKKRLSLAMAMLKSPAIVFMDEPTSGLDAAGAAAVMKFLTQMAQESNTLIIATIHQPSTSVFMSFDKTMVPANGRVCYCGEAAALAGFCADVGKPVPANANPADFFLELVNSEFSGVEVVDEIVAAWRARPEATSAALSAKSEMPARQPRPGFCSKLRSMFARVSVLTIRCVSLHLALIVQLIAGRLCAPLDPDADSLF